MYGNIVIGKCNVIARLWLNLDDPRKPTSRFSKVILPTSSGPLKPVDV